jgi:tRNA threonylcarbamoyladenosine biosynthesis protein TsaE
MIGEGQEEEVFEALTESPAQTLRLGELLGGLLFQGAFVALVGGLGSGKTLLAKGIARGLGVEDDREVTSPSFVLVNEYPGRVAVYHLDLYRLESFAEVEGIGWDEFICGSGVTLVEWAEKAGEHLPDERVEVSLQWAGQERRKLGFSGRGRAARELVKALKGRWMKEGMKWR